MRSVVLTLIALLFFGGVTLAQNSPIDSLINELQKAKEDSGKVNTLNVVSYSFKNKGNYDSAMKYGITAKELAEKIAFKKGIAKALNNIGAVYYWKGIYSEALKNHSQALKIMEDIGDSEGAAGSYIYTGLVYAELGNYTEAMKNYLCALKIYDLTGENKNSLANTYINIGGLYIYMRIYPEALKNYSQALIIMQQIGNKQAIAYCYTDIGIVNNLQGNYNDALKNYMQALQIKKEIGDENGMASCYNNMGDAYKAQNKYEDALKNYFLAMHIWEKNGNKPLVAVSYTCIGGVYIKQEKYHDAEKYLLDGLKLAKDIGSKDYIKDSYHELAELSEATGDYKKAYIYQKLFSKTKDTLLNEANNKQMTEMKTKYETETKDRELKLLNKDKEIQAIKIDRQKSTLRYLIGGFILLIVSAWILLYFYNQKRKVAFKHQILETKMQALRAQMNPHFTFNILNSIQYYAGENDMKAVQHYLRQFSKLIRTILDQSRTSYITLEQEINMLKLYLELEEMRFEKKFDYAVEVAENLDQRRILIPGMLIQPIVENAIKHGIEHKEGEALIKVSFYSKNSTLVCTVTDNGIGRTEAVRLKAGNDSHISVATAIINERMEALSSLYNIRLECRTEDLFDSEGMVAGTRVTMEMPIKN